jgi:hypothetical protein
MQTIGTVLVAVRQRSVVRMWMLALSSRCAHRLLYLTAVRRRNCQKDRSQVDGGPQLLALRRPSPHEPPVPVAYVLAQLDPLDTELSTGDLRVRAAITVTLRVLWYEHDGLLTGTAS